MRVLHISNWYPNEWVAHEGVFIREHFHLFSTVADSRLINVQVRPGDKWFEFRHRRYNERESAYFILTKITKVRLVEVLTSALLLWVLLKERASTFDIWHFHIAYPLLIHFRWWKRWWRQGLTKRILISEHWSAYHFNFRLPNDTKKLDRVKKIFRQNLPVVTVSQALLDDIRKFSNTNDFPSYVIANVIDDTVFRVIPCAMAKSHINFFMVNVWRDVKNPFPIIDGFRRFLQSIEPNAALFVGGYGPLLPQMKDYVQETGITDRVIFTGRLEKQEIAQYLACTDAYLYASTYETFSIACAQALFCGVPLMGPKIPAIMEYTSKDAYIEVDDNSGEGWERAMREFVRQGEKFHREKIAGQVRETLSTPAIVQKYRNVLESVAT